MNHIIIGQGLAGSILAWKLLQNNIKVIIYDNIDNNSSSKSAGAILSPLTGQNICKSWLFNECFNESILFYKSIETYFNIKFIYKKQLQWILNNKQMNILDKKYNNKSINAYIDNINKENNYININSCYYIDTNTLLDTFQTYFIKNNILINKKWDYNTDNNINNINTSQIIYCEGYHVINNPYFNYLPFRPKKGEYIIIETIHKSNKISDSIITSNFSCIPLHIPNQYWIGATYNHSLTKTISDNGKEQLIDFIDKYIPEITKYKIIKHSFGIRPNTLIHKPLIGIHPKYNNISIFNGFGSKGTLWIPYFANEFINNILYNTPLNKEVQIDKYYKDNTK